MAVAAALPVVLTLAASAQTKITETRYGGPAEVTYDLGFVNNVRKHPDGGVAIFDMVLIENDAPGSGRSEKGVWTDVVWGPHRARKILHLDDPRAHKAFLVVYTWHKKPPPCPLSFAVNGHHGEVVMENHEFCRWAEFPAAALRKGENVIDLSCPEAKSEEEGWELYLARADEFADGGGAPAAVGRTSFKSTDAGVSWKRSPFGPTGDTQAEYSVRLSLDRYRREGTLTTPVIDLWRGDAADFIVPLRRVVNVVFEAQADVPEGATVAYFVRGGTSTDPCEDDWEPYDVIGGGPGLNVQLDGEVFNRRYAQFKAVLSTTNPLVSPIIKTMQVTAEVEDQTPALSNVYVIRCENPVIRHPSVPWEWESWDRPEFNALRQRENLDEVTAGARTEFEAQLRLMDHATKRWWGGDPLPEYPGWDALSILDRIDKAGSGGMCIQANNFLAGMCMAYGWQARLVNIVAHETCEVWNDDYGKWIYLDGYHVNHYVYDVETGEPLSVLDMHQRLLDLLYPDRPIDWMKDEFGAVPEDVQLPVGLGVPGPRRALHGGFELAAFARMLPRNNWYEKPFPLPLTHGCTWWPWDGYINWYDDRTPPKRQYSRHTDRPQDMWPELNRVHVDATSAWGTDRLFLRFDTYTPNFSHYEVNVDEQGWKTTDSRWCWLLHPGKNVLEVRAVNKLGAAGKPTVVCINQAPP